MASKPSNNKLDLQLADEVGRFHNDPLAFVNFAWEWGKAGTPLEHSTGPDAWQASFLTRLGEQVKQRGFTGKEAVDPIRMAISSGHGTGKAGDKRVVIDTPDGKRVWGDLKPGDRVFAEDGTPTTITQIHDQGERDIYRVTFDDHSSTVVDGDHVWKVKGRQERRCERDWITLTTKEIIEHGTHRSNGVATARNFEIPQQGAVQYPHQPVPISPYLMGVYLGNGGRHSSVITINQLDSDVVESIRASGEEIHERVSDSGAWYASKLLSRLKALGISDLYSYEKHIPKLYKENSAEVRAEVLRGLLDTDGTCGKTGCINYASTSRSLIEDIVWLVRSLGGKASIHPSHKEGKYRTPDGELRVCRDCYRASITMPEGFQPFRAGRKAARLKAIKASTLRRYIDSIEPIGRAETMCITVDHPSHCYLTNDFIVTHNSTLMSWLAVWLLATRPHAMGTVTANSYSQLSTKTFAAIQKWMKSSIVSHWFEVGNERIYHKDYKESWFISAQSPSAENAESYAGQHNSHSTSFYCFDESSAIDDKIFETAEGGLTDGEPMMFMFGNPTKNTGKFYRACFGNERHRWDVTVVDSREASITNKNYLAQQIEDNGLDSDVCRVRILGLPPRQSDLQFIDSARVKLARERQPFYDPTDPLVVGIDIARGGADSNVIYFRRGSDGKSIPPIKIPGEHTKDSMYMVAKIAEVMSGVYTNGERPAAAMLDSVGIGGPIGDRLRQLGYKNVMDVSFAWKSPDPKCANMRSYCWSRMRDWLQTGAIVDDPQLEIDLTTPGYTHNSSDAILLESKDSIKKRGNSPDIADSLSLTFAMNVAPKIIRPMLGDRPINPGYQFGSGSPRRGTPWI